MVRRSRKSNPYPSSKDDRPPQPRVIEGTFVEHPPQRVHDPQFSQMYGHENPNPAYTGLPTVDSQPEERTAPQLAATPHEHVPLPTSESLSAPLPVRTHENFTPYLRVHRELVPRQLRRLLDATLASSVESPPPTEIDGDLPPITRRLMRYIGAADMAAAQVALSEEITQTRSALDQALTPTDADSDLPIFREAQHIYQRPWEEDS